MFPPILQPERGLSHSQCLGYLGSYTPSTHSVIAARNRPCSSSRMAPNELTRVRTSTLQATLPLHGLCQVLGCPSTTPTLFDSPCRAFFHTSKQDFACEITLLFVTLIKEYNNILQQE
ncbi:hypothetical protein Sjap_022259 [Stephania japonica]|uniref:Uncharacterized protein n=1 Tax=Stephania japonica TaxID=461633 RepID=A0AAP0HTJ2_9MAGN